MTVLETRPEFDDLYMELAVRIAPRSHCIRRHVGAVIAKDDRIISTGYNGPPSKTYNCDADFPEKGCSYDSKDGCYLAIHAEQNAILYAVRNRGNLENATLYVTLSPCISCARLIYHTGIRRVLYLNSYAEYKKIEADEGIAFLREFSVEVKRYTRAINATLSPLL